MYKSLHYLVLSMLLGMTAAASADDVGTAVVSAAVDAGFSELERQIIEGYFGADAGRDRERDQVRERDQDRDREADSGRNKGKKAAKGKNGLPPGLAKKDRLPPGLERQLQKNGTLPPGLAKRSLPADLDRRLPPPPEGYERQIIEDAAIVLVEKATGRIADVITDIFQ